MYRDVIAIFTISMAIAIFITSMAIAIFITSMAIAIFITSMATVFKIPRNPHCSRASSSNNIKQVPNNNHVSFSNTIINVMGGETTDALVFGAINIYLFSLR